MRCKNCGTENDDNRYICENCGSPLYDDEDFVNNDFTENNLDPENNGVQPAATQNTDTNAERQGKTSDTEKASDKKNIIVIAVLAVVLIAIIASIIVIASTKSNRENVTTKPSTTSSQTTESALNTTKYTKPETTKPTTSSTTTTKETTTKAKIWSVKVVSKGGGTVSGGGNYKDGENVTISATADAGYEFDGWYSGGEKISSAPSYSFSAVKNISVSAVFNPVSTEPSAENIEGGLEP